jgi:hypothetical protein
LFQAMGELPSAQQHVTSKE